MRYLLALLALIASVNCQSCPVVTFSTCKANLCYDTGIDQTLQRDLFTNYTIMYNQFLTLFSQNPGTTQGMLQVCNAIENFNLCMYGNLFCLDMAYLSNQTDDIVQAFMSRGTYDMYANFNCGPGINTLLHEGLSCSQRIMSGYQNYLQTCVASYRSSVTHDPQSGCKYVSDMINCWSSPFLTAPCRRDRSADIWWACESNRRLTWRQFPNCGLSCDLVRGPFTTAQAEEYLEKHHKIVDGVHHFKIPDYMGLVNGKVAKIEGKWMHD